MSSSSFIPETPPRSHRKHKKTPSNIYATPKTPFRHDTTLDGKISSKASLLKTPASNRQQANIYQTPITPKSSISKKRNEIITPPSSTHHQESAPFNGRLLFPAKVGRIGSGRSHSRSLNGPNLTTLLTQAAVESSSSEAEEEEGGTQEQKSNEPQTPRKQIFNTPMHAPKHIVDRDEFEEATAAAPSLAPKSRNPFNTQSTSRSGDDELKKELLYVDKYGRTKVEKLSEEEAQALQKTKRKLTFN